MLKDYLTRLGAQFELKDIRRDPHALAEFRTLGVLLPPATIIDGVLVTGFDPMRLDELLAE